MAADDRTSELGHRRASVLRFAATGVIASALFYILCWAGQFLPVDPATHMYLQLFTNAETTSALALMQGTVWAIAFGLVGGAILAFAYNATAFLSRG
jgi:hypothetical protein